jgi:hypothetical protein
MHGLHHLPLFLSFGLLLVNAAIPNVSITLMYAQRILVVMYIYCIAFFVVMQHRMTIPRTVCTPSAASLNPPPPILHHFVSETDRTAIGRPRGSCETGLQQESRVDVKTCEELGAIVGAHVEVLMQLQGASVAFS